MNFGGPKKHQGFDGGQGEVDSALARGERRRSGKLIFWSLQLQGRLAERVGLRQNLKLQEAPTQSAGNTEGVPKTQEMKKFRSSAPARDRLPGGNIMRLNFKAEGSDEAWLGWGWGLSFRLGCLQSLLKELPVIMTLPGFSTSLWCSCKRVHTLGPFLLWKENSAVLFSRQHSSHCRQRK